MVRLPSYIAAIGRYNLFDIRYRISNLKGLDGSKPCILNYSDTDSIAFGVPHNDESSRS
jgi:hypothetical protein